MTKEISNIKARAQISQLSNQLQQLKQKAQKAKNPEDLKKAADEFESLFIFQLLKEMRKTIMKSDLFGNGLGEDIFQSMWDEKIAEKIAQQGRLGIAEMVMHSFENDSESKEHSLESLQMLQNLMQTPNPSVHPLEKKVEPFIPIIHKAAKEVKINQRLLKAVILAESAGNPQAVSSKGAQGLMQLMPDTASYLGVQNVFDPEENIFAGARYLKQLLQEFKGNLKLALAAYNAGPSNVKKYNDIPPFKETQQYVRKVLSYFHALR